MDQRSPTISMARAMEHSLLARRLCLTLDIALSIPNSAHTILSGIRVCPVPFGVSLSGGLTGLGLRLGDDDLGLQRAAMRDEYARFAQAFQLRLADAELAEDREIMFALRSREKWAIGGPEYRGLRPDIVVGEIDMRSFIDGEQRRRHCNVDILALPRLLAAVERCENRNHGLQSGIDVCMRQAVGTRLRQRVAIMTNAVVGKAGLGLHGWRIG